MVVAAVWGVPAIKGVQLKGRWQRQCLLGSLQHGKAP